MSELPQEASPVRSHLTEGRLLDHQLLPGSHNCLSQALCSARQELDDVVFLAVNGDDDQEGHVVLRDIGSGLVREPDAAPGGSGLASGPYARANSFMILGAVPPELLRELVELPVPLRAAAILASGPSLAAIAHRRFGAVMPITPELPPAAPGGGSSTNGQDTHVDAWLNSLGGSVSQSDKDALAQTSNDAQTLKSWFDDHKRGDPALNDMPQNVADAESRLLSNPSTSKQIQSGDLVTRDAIGSLISSLDNAANSAKSSFQSFQRNNSGGGSDEVGAAAQASILQADLPILDASGSSNASVDGKFNLDDLKAVAGSSDAGVPAPLKQAAAAYADPSSFDTLSKAGDAGDGLVNNDGLGKLVSSGVGFSRQDSDVHDWTSDLGSAVSDSDKASLNQIGDDATTLKAWFDDHSRGDPALNDMPKNVSDAENRLLANDAVSKQIQVGGLVTRDSLGGFLGSLDGAAKSAKGSWDSFEKSSNASNPVAASMAADADILQANLPVYDAAGSSAAKTDGLFNTDDLKAIASGTGNAGLPTALKNAASLFSDPGMFHMLDVSGNNLATPHPDGLANSDNLGNWISKYAGTIDPATIGQTLSEAADRSMVAGVDTSKLGPDVFQNPQNYTGAQKAAMIQQLQDLNTQVEAGVAQDNWVDTVVAGHGINTDYKQVEGDIAQKIAQLSNDKDVQQFRGDNYDKTLQSIVQADASLHNSLQSFYDGDLQSGKALSDTLDSKGSGTVEQGLSSFLQTANTLNVALGTDGNAKPALDMQQIAQKSGKQDALQQAYTDDILSGKNLSDAISNGTNMTTAVQQFQIDAANLGAVLPTQFVSDNADKLQQTFSDTVTDGVLDYATSDEVSAAFTDSNGNIDTAKLTDAINQAVQQNPDLGKDSTGAPISTSQTVSLVGQIVNEVRQGVKMQDAIAKVYKASGITGGPGAPTGDAAKAYNSGLLHLVSAVLTGGVLAAKDAGSSSSGKGVVDATQLGASLQISGALLESGTKYLKDSGNTTFSSSQLKTIESAGKLAGGAGGAIGGVLGIFSGVESLKSGDQAGGAFGLTNGITSLLSGVSSAVEGGIGLAGEEVTGALVPAIAAGASAALGIAGGVIGALSAVAIGLYEGISAAVHNVAFTNQFVGDADRLGVTGGTEDSNFPDPNTAPSDNSPPP